MNFVDLVNDIHRNAMGLNGKTGIDFFKEQYFINNTVGNFDRNGDGEYDSSYIFRLTGAYSLDPREQIGLEGTITLSAGTGTVQVPYASTDMVADHNRRIPYLCDSDGSTVVSGIGDAFRTGVTGGNIL